MKQKHTQIFSFLIIVSLIVFAVIFSYNNSVNHIDTEKFNVAKLSSEEEVVGYLKIHHKLPNYFITKREARKFGWKPEKGNLCEAVPGKIIGGDIFYNRQHRVPSKANRKWFEADLNYSCGNRGRDRIVFSNDGLIYVSYDHYNTFQKR